MNMYPKTEAGYLLHRRVQAAAKAKKAKKAVRKEKIRKAGTAPSPLNTFSSKERFFLGFGLDEYNFSARYSQSLRK